MTADKSKTHSVLLGIGSNLGDRGRNIAQGLSLLSRKHDIRVERVSGLIETAPVNGPPQGPYLNAAAEVLARQEPLDLLLALKDVEAEAGRVDSGRNGPRPLDLDILLYDSRIVEEPRLEIPHARMLERAFVLEPLADIAPQRVHPRTGRTILSHWLDLKTSRGGEDG